MRLHLREKSTALAKQRHRLQRSQAGQESAAYAFQLWPVRSQTSHLGCFSIYSLETKPLRCATLFQGASTASAGSSSICCAKSVILSIARRSRRAVNQSGGHISKSLGTNCSATSEAKTSP